MSDVTERMNALLSWYTNHARRFLEKHAPNDLAAIDKQGFAVEQIVRRANDDVAICFLGDAGVGKSTLINALVSEQHNILPHGGIGPLTAQATVVRYAEKPYFRATYLPAHQLNRTLFTLQQAHARAHKRDEAAVLSPELDGKLDEEDKRDAEFALPVNDAEAPAEWNKLEAYQRQIRLLIQGKQEGQIDLPYLIDALCAVLGYKNRFGLAPIGDDILRVERLRQCVRVASTDGVHRERHAGDDFNHWLDELREHASGFLAPLIKNLEVGWNAEVLRNGLVLVDLPGVGVANDEYQRVTAEWIRGSTGHENNQRKPAQAIVLVVNNRGVTAASAEMLRTTGFLNHLMYDSHDAGSDLATLSVAVVKVDEIAYSDWKDDRARNSRSARRWNEHFEDACARAIDMVQRQMRQQLERIAASGPDATRQKRQAVVDHLLDTMQVHTVSAPEYRQFMQNDEELPARIKNADESRIPNLVFALQKVAAAHRGRRKVQAEAALTDFAKRVQTSIDLIRAQWEGEAKAEKEAQELREELDTFLAPKRSELDVRKGAFREFLQESIPTQIDARVAEATLLARQDIGKYLRELGDVHWATLRAAVRKHGVHESKNGFQLDLPNELALQFEEPIADVWSRHILVSLRKRTKELGQNYVDLVGEVVLWAKEREARVRTRVVEALRENLDAQMKDLRSVGKDAVDDLKDKVRAELHAKLIKRVRGTCQNFVNNKQDEGAGVKRRILSFFHDELAAIVVEEAGPVASKVLRGNFAEVREEINARFTEYQNPLDAARDAIVESHENAVRRRDARMRAQVLEEIATIVAAMPGGGT